LSSAAPVEQTGGQFSLIQLQLTSGLQYGVRIPVRVRARVSSMFQLRLSVVLEGLNLASQLPGLYPRRKT